MYLGNLFKPLKVAFISTYPPRRCGIATYTADLTGNFRQLYGGSNHNDDPHIFEVIAEQQAAGIPPAGSELPYTRSASRH